MQHFLKLILLSVLLGSWTACESKQRPVEQAVVGQWVSNTSSVTFDFFEDGTFVIDDPAQRQLTGTYHGIGESEDLTNAQFVLNGGYNIRFMPRGDAFFIYIDGTGNPDILYFRNLQQTPSP